MSMHLDLINYDMTLWDVFENKRKLQMSSCKLIRNTEK